ncbi:cytochrome P450 [Parafrankia sp. FMc2]|uniref:cytochrome P450 n=1 Tax=Parafrankia sp. FMc2 TaxID=3233196 RepID=UPI0034D795A0
MPVQTIDFAAPSFRTDPFPAWSDLRGAGPLHRDVSGAWIVVSHREVGRLLADPRVGKDLRRLSTYGAQRPYGPDGLAEYYIEQWMECRLPTMHRQWRQLVLPGFTHRAVHGLRAELCQTANDLLTHAPSDGQFDLLRDFARPFPVAVIVRVLGLTDLDTDRLAQLSRAIAAVLEPNAAAPARQAGDAALEELAGLLWDAVRADRGSHPDGFLRRLVDANKGLLSPEQLIATVLLLYLSGNDTITGLIANGVLALAGVPDQADRLRAHPELLPMAVEEVLRYDAPACVAIRTTYEPMTIDGVTVERGAALLLAISSANRDPEAFAEPDVFHVDRRPNRHLAFGTGEHTCVGIGLARMEAAIALEALLRHFPRLVHDPSTLRWSDALYLHTPENLVLLSTMPRDCGGTVSPTVFRQV